MQLSSVAELTVSRAANLTAISANDIDAIRWLGTHVLRVESSPALTSLAPVRGLHLRLRSLPGLTDVRVEDPRSLEASDMACLTRLQSTLSQQQQQWDLRVTGAPSLQALSPAVPLGALEVTDSALASLVVPALPQDRALPSVGSVRLAGNAALTSIDKLHMEAPWSPWFGPIAVVAANNSVLASIRGLCTAKVPVDFQGLHPWLCCSALSQVADYTKRSVGALDAGSCSTSAALCLSHEECEGVCGDAPRTGPGDCWRPDRSAALDEQYQREVVAARAKHQARRAAAGCKGEPFNPTDSSSGGNGPDGPGGPGDDDEASRAFRIVVVVGVCAAVCATLALVARRQWLLRRQRGSPGGQWVSLSAPPPSAT